MMSYVLSFLSGAIASFGFSILMQAPMLSWLPCALLGGGVYLLYMLLLLVMPKLGAALVASVIAGIVAHIMAKHFHMISTIFLTMAIVPLVPGYALYRCAVMLGDGETTKGLNTGLEAMIFILVMVLGLWVGGFLFRFGDKLIDYVKEKNVSISQKDGKKSN